MITIIIILQMRRGYTFHMCAMWYFHYKEVKYKWKRIGTVKVYSIYRYVNV